MITDFSDSRICESHRLAFCALAAIRIAHDDTVRRNPENGSASDPLRRQPGRKISRHVIQLTQSAPMGCASARRSGRLLHMMPATSPTRCSSVSPCGKCVRQAHHEFGIKAHKLISHWRRPRLPSTFGSRAEPQRRRLTARAEKKTAAAAEPCSAHSKEDARQSLTVSRTNTQFGRTCL
jgi:hypothetical protein